MTRRIVITGGGTGLGRAIAQRIASDETQLTLVGRRRDRLEETASLLPLSEVQIETCDLADPDQVDALARTLRRGGPLDGLVLNAGGNISADGDETADIASSWRANFDANVLTAVLLTEAVADLIKPQDGRVVAMSSVAGLRGSGAYGAAKAALNGWVWWMSGRFAERGITVNAVAPGFVPDTEFWEQRIADNPDIPAQRLASVPIQRPGTPREVAEAVAYFLNPEAGWTTGQILGVNGGVVLGH